MFFRNVLLVLLIFCVAACASQYGSLPDHHPRKAGYHEYLLDNENRIVTHQQDGINNSASATLQAPRYAVKYQGTTSDTKDRIEGFWQQRANELCPEGFQVERYSAYFKHGTIRSPVNGMMVNLGTQQPIVHGIISCLL